MGDLNNNFRLKLREVFERIKAKIAGCLETARAQGEIPEDLDIQETSAFILMAFEGALLEMKITKTTDPHKLFNQMAFEKILKASSGI